MAEPRRSSSPTGVRHDSHSEDGRYPTLSALSEAQRQTFAETMMRTQAAAFAALMIVADGNHKTVMAEMLNRFRTRFETQFGLELAGLALTESRGFVTQVP